MAVAALQRQVRPDRRTLQACETVCATHGGSAPQVRLAAQRRLDALVPLAINTLADVAEKSGNDAARVRAAQEILKGAGIQAPSEKDELMAGVPNPDLDGLIEQALRARLN